MAARVRVLIPVAILALASALTACATRQEIASPPPQPAERTYEEASQDRPDADPAEGGEGQGSGSGSGSASGSEAASAAEGEGATGSAAPAGSAMTPAEQGSSADRQLSESISRFGDELRSAASQAAAADTGGGGASGEEQATEVAGTGGGAGGSQDPEEQAERSQGAGSGGRAAAADPADIPDGSDDDVVARQLREMAENEPDPELRAIYWQEYIDYKSGQKRQRSEPDPEQQEEDDEPESE